MLRAILRLHLRFDVSLGTWEADDFQSLQGPAFDRAFLAAMVGDHDAGIAKVMAGRQQFSSNAGLQALLGDTLPTLREHRQQAYRLLGQETPRQARRAPGGR
ncbi:hypothetical protein BHS06_00340 [Myxococcus xanthus]|uniref:DUF4142 domain-containing protein n=1 Tax=Myxococcus xanthus TaxID=34 RepID=UPI001163EDAF|nr:DUF4142 domain-containing protein [Myxococcus xanthus]QDE87516.1 hypothetical protein BHS06_00340 [Myxococcus xanthus]